MKFFKLLIPLIFLLTGCSSSLKLIHSESIDLLIDSGALVMRVPETEIMPFRPKLISGRTSFEVKDLSKNIELIVMDDLKTAQQLCKKLFRIENGLFMGCAGWTELSCTIIIPSRTTLSVLGHEFRHCFNGAFHM